MKKEDMTPEQLAKREAKNVLKKDQRANMQKLIAMITSAEDGDPITGDMVLLAISLKKQPIVRTTGAKTVVLNMFAEVGDTLDEGAVFMEYKLGRLEMRKATTNLIKKADKPENRRWISFNPETGIYTLEAIGPEAPEGWTGYTPVKIEEIEIM